MSLVRNREVNRYTDQELLRFPVEEGVHIYKSAFVGLSPNGRARPLIRGDLFIGIAHEEVVRKQFLSNQEISNLYIRTYTIGDFGLSLDVARMALTGCAVYASSDDKLTVIALGNSYVGIMVNCIAEGSIILRLDTFRFHR